MPTPKGYTSQEKDDRLSSEFVTISPTGPSKFSLDVRDMGSVHQAATDAVEAGSTTSVIVATSHVMLRGDRIRFTSGALITLEADVFRIIDANSVELGQTLSAVPGAGDTFEILRQTSLTLGSNGGIVNTFIRDGLGQFVLEDTAVPANNRPLPVKLTGLDGDVIINSANLNLEVQTSHIGANADSMRIGDGVEEWAINVSNEGLVRDGDAITQLIAIEADTTVIAGDTTSLDTKFDVNLSTRATEVTAAAILADTASIDASVDVALSTRASEATAASILADTAAIDTATATIAGDTTSIDGKLPATLGQKTMAASMAVVIASDQSPVNVVVTALTVVDLMDTPVLDASSTAIPTATFKEIVAVSAAEIKKIQVFDTTGEFYGIYVGAAASEVLKAVVGPGSNETIELNIAAGARIALQSLTGADIVLGSVTMNFMG